MFYVDYKIMSLLKLLGTPTCRAFLAVILSVIVVIPSDADEFALGQLSPRGKRRVIYVSDLSNTTCHMSEPATADELRHIVRNYADLGSIDTLVQEIWHQGWSTFWRTELCPYDSRFQHKRLEPLMDAGTMPVEIYIDECHRQKMEFIAGFRMNDRHGANPKWFAKIAQEKPSWILHDFHPTSGGADPKSYQIGCALDYSVQEVREWLLSIMREVASRFDVDGIEFNFTRMPECFPRESATESHPLMTEFVRSVREMLDEVGAQKEQQLLLGVRVLQTVTACRKMGLDVPTWIREGLVNYVSPGDICFTEFNAPYEDFVRLARTHDCYVYPQVECRLGIERWKDSNRTEFQTPEQYRAALRNIYGSGADGFSTQNYFVMWGPRFNPGQSGVTRPNWYPERLTTLKTLRDPTQLTGGDRHYIFSPLWGPVGRGPGNTYQPEMIDLARNTLDQRDTFRFRLCERLPDPSLATLTCMPAILPGDDIAIDVNGTVIPPENIQIEWSEKENTPPKVRFTLHSPPAIYGDNQLGMRLLKSATTAPAESRIQMYDVEVFVPAP